MNSPFLKTAGALTAAVATGGIAFARYQEHRVDRTYPGYEKLTHRSSTSNEIVDWFAEPSLTSELIVLIPGLASSVSTVAGLGSQLRTAGHGILMHNRAGYGGSAVLNSAPYHLNESVEDLDSIIGAASKMAGDNPLRIHLVGHSLGGYIAYRYAAQHPEKVASVSLLDPTHPKELVRSEAQKFGGESVNLTLRTTPGAMKLGGGLLLRKNVISYAEGYTYADRVWNDVLAASAWTAAQREWSYIYPHLLDGPDLPDLDAGVAIQVIAAAHTVESDPAQLELYREFSSGREKSLVHMVAGASHRDILTEQSYIDEVCALILSLMEEEK